MTDKRSSSKRSSSKRSSSKRNKVGFSQVLARDGKVPNYVGTEGWMDLLKAVVGVLPLTLAFLLPVSLGSWALAKIGADGEKKKKKRSKEDDEAFEPVQMVESRAPWEEREFDIVLLGATGFTGTLTAEYLANSYGNSIRWAIAGRNKANLEKVKKKLIEIDADLEELPILIADSFDIDSLNNLCARTRVVATTVGPFAKYGTPLVRQCIANGTDYCDITGEASWVRVLVEQYQAQAAEAGVRLVPFSGNDCVPYDLLVGQLAKRIKTVNPEEDVISVELYDDMRSGPSGGTINTLIYSFTKFAPKKSSLSFDPMDMTFSGERAKGKVVDKIRVGPGYSKKHESWYTFFPLSTTNKVCVRRSNALLGYSQTTLSYKEQLTVPSFAAVVTWVINYFALGLTLANTWLRTTALELKLLPSPGSGPSRKEMDKGYLQLFGYAKGSLGTKAKAMLYFPNDPGYVDTARILAESALTLALEHNNLPERFGVLTPNAGLGDALLDRLVNTGSEFEVFLDE